MSRTRTQEIEAFLLAQVRAHPTDIGTLASDHFGISRQAVHRHLARLVGEGRLLAEGATRARHYRLPDGELLLQLVLPVTPDMQEDRVWREHVLPHMRALPQNVQSICSYGFSEMLNNVIDHSEAAHVVLHVARREGSIWMGIQDDGIGVFRKVAAALGLAEDREAVLELAKGGVTTDPKRHSGQGIFFTARAFDVFTLVSRGVLFLCTDGRMEIHDSALHGLASQFPSEEGTGVYLLLDLHSERTLKGLFDQYAMPDDEDYGFTRTQVQVELLKFEDEGLVSRSQARRLLARLNNFREVNLDFHGLENIGQAFADEIFRVFHLDNPGVKLIWQNAEPEVERMIRRAIAGRRENGA